jgi:hypothetical protein
VFKKVTAYCFYRLLSHISTIPIPQDTGDFRLMRRTIVDALSAMPEQQRFIRGMVSWVGGVQVPIVYVRQPRHAGATKYPLWKMIRFAADAITSFSVKPLRIATWMSLVAGSVALALLGYSIIQWFRDGTIEGWTSIMAAICVFGSLQFFLLGIIGEYVGRLFNEVKRRPLYLIDCIVSGHASVRPPIELSSLAPMERCEVVRRLHTKLKRQATRKRRQASGVTARAPGPPG